MGRRRRWSICRVETDALFRTKGFPYTLRKSVFDLLVPSQRHWSELMPHRIMSTSTVTATVEGVMPAIGLAYLAGDDQRDWTLTRSTRGGDFASLKEGQRVQLTVEQHNNFAVVREYADVT